MSAEREPPGEARGCIGPVEPGEGSWTQLVLRPGPRPEPPPRLLSRRQQRLVASFLLLCALALTALRVANYPEQAANSPPPQNVPFPSQSTRFSYAGPVPDQPGVFSLELAVHNSGPGPVDVLGVRQGYRGLTVLVSGWLPRTVPPGGTLSLRVGLRVTDCSGAPADATLPFLDVTLRNTRAMETVSQILGADYARDLSAALHSACDDTDKRTPTTSTDAPDKPVR
ncbi:Tat pathway signal sequence domain protein [Kitasatospora sp. NPDC057198]|uniref:Tat pathway signal sequence domain protein n=1 Tax=Kitasatospora sp. NPDC057198 TaxID=3346046 RepID=UPI0036368EDC